MSTVPAGAGVSPLVAPSLCALDRPPDKNSNGGKNTTSSDVSPLGILKYAYTFEYIFILCSCKYFTLSFVVLYIFLEGLFIYSCHSTVFLQLRAYAYIHGE